MWAHFERSFDCLVIRASIKTYETVAADSVRFALLHLRVLHDGIVAIRVPIP